MLTRYRTPKTEQRLASRSLAGPTIPAGAPNGSLIRFLSKQMDQAKEDPTEPPGRRLVLLNFSHALTPDQIEAVGRLADAAVDRVVEEPLQLINELPFAPQVRSAVDELPITDREWQFGSFVLHLPGLSPIAALVLAEMHGRTGGFPAIVRMSRSGMLNQYEVAEVIGLQPAREVARMARRATGEDQ
jgi:hypothetical protein